MQKPTSQPSEAERRRALKAAALKLNLHRRKAKERAADALAPAPTIKQPKGDM